MYKEHRVRVLNDRCNYCTVVGYYKLSTLSTLSDTHDHRDSYKNNVTPFTWRWK